MPPRIDAPSAPRIAVVGGGLAGCECALTLARAGVACVLYEQKPTIFSPAHASPCWENWCAPTPSVPTTPKRRA